MCPDDRRVGGECSFDVEGEVGVGDVEPPHGALLLPAGLEVQRERVDPAEVLDLLRACAELQGIGVEAEGIDGGGGEQREAVGSRLGGAHALQQSVDDDDVDACQLVAAGDATPDEGPVVDEHLEVQSRGQPTGVAVAGRRLVDAAQPAPEGDIGRLDSIEQQEPSARPSSTNRKAASPSNFVSRNGGSSRPTIVSRRSPAMAGACSISLPDR